MLNPWQPPEDGIPVRPLEEENGRESEGRGSVQEDEKANRFDDHARGEERSRNEEAEEFDDREQLESGSREPKRLQDPKLPSQEEIRAHELTHLPYRSWCKVCVEAAGPNRRHQQRTTNTNTAIPEFHLDYVYRSDVETASEEDQNKCVPIIV